jgi:hypothetical protein
MGTIIDTLYIVLGIGVMCMVVLVGLIRILRDIRNIKDNE